MFPIRIQLEAVPLDGDHEAEARAMLKGGMLLPLFCPPSGLLQGVGHHISRVTVISWVEVKGNVRPCPRTTLQIHMEPVCPMVKSPSNSDRLPLLQPTLDSAGERESRIMKRFLVIKCHFSKSHCQLKRLSSKLLKALLSVMIEFQRCLVFSCVEGGGGGSK